MAVVTISRQLGSCASEIAERVAQRMGYRLVARDLINEAARRAGAPEAVLSTVDELGLLDYAPSPRVNKMYRKAVEQVMHEMATGGNVVILGRAGQVILGHAPAILHARIIAPLDVRAGRVAEREGIPLAAAQAQVQASDRFRRNYLRRFYHVRWDDPELYDVIINTGDIDPGRAAYLICALLTYPDQNPAVAKEPA